MIDARILNPSISMSARAPNLPQLMQSMQNLSSSKTNEKLALAQEGRAQELFAGQKELQEQGIAANAQGIEANAMSMDSARRAQYMKSIADTKPVIDKLIQAGDVEGLKSFLSNRAQQLQANGLPTETTDEAYMSAASGDLQSIQQGVDTAWQEVYGQDSRNQTSVSQREFDYLTEIAKEDSERGKAARVKLGLETRAGAQSAQERIAQNENLSEAVRSSQSSIEGGKAGAKVTSSGIAARNQGYIDSGIDAADATANLKKTLNLLETVDTGGFNNIALKAKQMFGVEGADEAELSANMGKAILAQLKPIFGAAFTAAEGERLERIESQFGKSTEANIRLINNVLKTAERAARRGLAAAEAEGDTFTANEIREILKGISDNVPTVLENKPAGNKFTIVEVK